MKSLTRQSCEEAIFKYSEYLNKIWFQKNQNKGNGLFVGVGGDSTPKGEYSYLFSNIFDITSFDINAKYHPDVVGDITNTKFSINTWDCIVCVQVMEHIKNLWDLPEELERILKPNGYLIIDCPFMYPNHKEDCFGDYWRILPDGMRQLFSKFEEIDNYCTQNNTSFLFQKKKR
jgi:SAM-dependent methyltransferase